MLGWLVQYEPLIILDRTARAPQDFFAPTYLRMKKHYLAHDAHAAAQEQAFKLAAGNIISKYGGASAERALYRAFPLTRGVNIGPPRLPKLPFNESSYSALASELKSIGFWQQLTPPVVQV